MIGLPSDGRVIRQAVLTDRYRLRPPSRLDGAPRAGGRVAADAASCARRQECVSAPKGWATPAFRGCLRTAEPP